MIKDDVYQELEDVLGPENVSREPALLDGYAWQPLWNMGPEFWVHRPEAVVLPGSTEDVQAVVRICNRHGLMFKPLSTGWGAIAGPGSEGVIQIDLRRMDRILEIDEKNMFMVVEPYAIGGVMRAEAMKVGLNTHMNSAGAHSSPLASATSAWGCSWDGIVMGWSPRNLLGAEWVLPTGDLLRLGSLGSGYGWYLGDGPGPSLRGIARGRCGGFGGNGVFTRAAIKLYHWAGPPVVEVKSGVLSDVEMEMPENIRTYYIIFRNRKDMADATYKLAREGVGYNLSKVSLGTGITLWFPHLVKTQAFGRSTSLRNLFYSIQFGWIAVLMGNSPGELDFQETVLREVVSECHGFALDMGDLRLDKSVTWGLISGGYPAVAFRIGGMFNIGWGQDEAHYAEIDAQEEGERIKKEWITKGSCIEDLGDSSFHFFNEEGNIGHYEECWWFDHRDRKQAEAIWPIEVDYTTLHVERCMESGLDCDPAVRKLYSPMQGNYNRWQTKIREAFDPAGCGDPTFYTAEADIPAEGIDPAKLRRLAQLAAEKHWSEEGPPGY